MTIYIIIIISIFLIWILVSEYLNSRKSKIKGHVCHIVSKLNDNVYEVIITSSDKIERTYMQSWKGTECTIGEDYNIIIFNNQRFIFNPV